MTLVFAAGDVGGARALLPVVRLCHARGLPFAVVHHGFIADAMEPGWPAVDPGRDPGEALTSLGAKCLAFATSVSDMLALNWARAAAARGVRTLHLLDNWSSYRRRMDYGDAAVFRPDVYAVPDQRAAEAAIAEGIDPTTVRVIGHPALADLAGEVARAGSCRGSRTRLSLLFVSEPAALDQGSTPDTPDFRGYTETQVLAILCAALAPLADTLTLTVLPHPREDAAALAETWETVRGPLDGAVVPPGNGRAHVLGSDGVVGMASILLYEAWLVGLPVLSVQPNLRLNELTLIGRRDGVRLIDDPDAAPDLIQDWVAKLRTGSPLVPRPDLVRHASAADACLSLCGPETHDTP
ncbi:hypothetical protein [Rhodospira trueperi]|uniref:UDP-N-acetylglucosamine 2-epimerase (Non-hydrolysing) n=1 Tax=Rhodospira trueperi TaxID=69960 RepID=A0A1G6ZCK1_9PROT|nr:hypothetical protein [Rhodospira trueperi]SDE00379.1 hypothetical protein SAMN05421720_102334 [Rhodospira trueperi]